MGEDRNDDRPEPDVRFDFGHDIAAPRLAREALEPLIDEPGDPIADKVRIVASELVTNVVLHTDDGGSMLAWDPKPNIPFRLEVADRDHATPKKPTEPLLIGGHGLEIVDACTDEWGVQRSDTGKVVWAEFNRPIPGSAVAEPTAEEGHVE